MGTVFVTSTGYGNSICDKYWLWEHVISSCYGNYHFCDKYWLWEHVISSCYGNYHFCDKYWLWDHNL